MNSAKAWASAALFGGALLAASLAAAKEPGSKADQALLKLLEIRTLYVEPLKGEATGGMRDMLIASVQRTGLFVMTENPKSADAVLRGSGEDLIYQELERRRAGINARGNISTSRREDGDYSRNASGFGVGDTETSELRERRHEAVASVRILLPNGEIVWSTTRESNGAKFRGSAHDVAEKIAEDLIRAYQKAEKLDTP